MSIIQITGYKEFADATRHPFSVSLSKDDSQIPGSSDWLDGNGFRRDRLIQEGSNTL